VEGVVTAVSRSGGHTFSKRNEPTIRLLAGLGVEGDAHLGATVKHRSRLARAAASPNLRQVHLMHAELFDELEGAGFRVEPGQMGDNITTRGIDLLALPVGTRLRLGSTALVEVTGLRTPCNQIDRFQQGLKNAVLGRDPEGKPTSRAGVMSVVIAGGEVRPGDAIRAQLPGQPHRPLAPV
jgi:MOSC domain-containing protein YiiM